MTETEPSLADLRAEIDQIDDSVHDLLIRRTALVGAIARQKLPDGRPPIRPQREAAILSRLASRHTGPLPFLVIARIWRELISAFTTLQQPLSVAVFSPDDPRDCWDLARDHFGTLAPITVHHTPSPVIRAVADRTATVGVLPMILSEEIDPWWQQLLSPNPDAPRIVARLPAAAARNNGRGASEALVIGARIAEETAFGHNLFVIETAGPVSRTRLTGALTALGLPVSLVAIQAGPGLCHTLIEIADAVRPGDPRLTKLSAQLGEPIDRIYTLGGYAGPAQP